MTHRKDFTIFIRFYSLLVQKLFLSATGGLLQKSSHKHLGGAYLPENAWISISTLPCDTLSSGGLKCLVIH